MHHKLTPGGGGPQAGEEIPRKPRSKELKRQKDAYLQVGRYLLDQFSVSAIRSHATIALVDRDRIQFYHADRSVILVSSALSSSESDRTGGLEKFIAIMIAFGRLTLGDDGILHNLHGGKLLGGNQKSPTRGVPRGAVRMQEGNELVFGGDGKTEPFTLTLGEVIYRERLVLAGRSTKVLHAKSPRWKDVDLVVKISWPGSGWGMENEFLDKATSEAKGAAKDKWALKHLPRVFYAQDVVFGLDSTHERVASLFDEAEIINEEYKHERRTLRIIIQERLYPLKKLTNVKDIAQVLLDVACGTYFRFVHWSPDAYVVLVHRWLYERVGILHRDLSLSNIMYRTIKGKVHGVLTDYDIASWTRSLTGDHIKSLQQRVGTPPFMAIGLLDGSDALHLYRHDVESLFYVMVILTTHYEVRGHRKGETGGMRMRQGELPFEEWFDEPSYNELALFKKVFLLKRGCLELSPTFEDFRGWLMKLRKSFNRGFWANQGQWEEDMEEPCDKDTPTPFDDETLGGHVHYSALIGPVRHLKGKLKDLVIRYDPQSPPLATSTGAAQACL